MFALERHRDAHDENKEDSLHTLLEFCLILESIWDPEHVDNMIGSGNTLPESDLGADSRHHRLNDFSSEEKACDDKQEQDSYTK